MIDISSNADNESIPLGLAASAAGVSSKTMRILAATGQIDAHRNSSGRWMVDPASIEALAASVTIGQAARLAGCSEAVIRNLWDRGDITGFRLASGHRRVYRDSLTAWCQQKEATMKEDDMADDVWCPECNNEVAARIIVYSPDLPGIHEWRCVADHRFYFGEDHPAIPVAEWEQEANS